MQIAAGILFIASAVAELGGVILIVRGIRSAKKMLDTPVEHIIDGGGAGDGHVWPPRQSSDSPEVFLLEAMERQGTAVALVVIGIVAGTIGNFLTLG
ncbi:hypothetical protein DEJ30_09085 [Curtobacterium sp. MCPF17_003]|uniref:hypothetical protein n=1 Tax=Curtobacterium sp. MCPF17_003 TaxID=2175637 RepID=UPI000D951DD1|nr:hypothetical protein [Curtobacterium sp. MCPF17_003]PYY64228.1 hypothetical protein DEJ30_09085 [Curtobacterium sp. MCPF17_003]